ncbi:GerMN domain-containing protein [Micromonospora sp. SH-82]|uniref:GerMN domain-containing protein n=1 Tax=Micromonospora sp. SH-82 TaxID=3132938 RepID=UPI003EBB2373
MAVVLCAVAGCGVSAEDSPRAIEPPGGPHPVVTTPAVEPSGQLTVALCFVRDDALVRVDRRVTAAATPDEQLRLLEAGPTSTDREAGLTTALVGVSRITGVRVTGREALVDVSNGQVGTGRTDEMLAFGQIVCTLTARTDVDLVSFLHDSRRLGVPRADGSLSTGPLTVSDYPVQR